MYIRMGDAANQRVIITDTSISNSKGNGEKSRPQISWQGQRGGDIDR